MVIKITGLTAGKKLDDLLSSEYVLNIKEKKPFKNKKWIIKFEEHFTIGHKNFTYESKDE